MNNQQIKALQQYLMTLTGDMWHTQNMDRFTGKLVLPFTQEKYEEIKAHLLLLGCDTEPEKYDVTANTEYSKWEAIMTVSTHANNGQPLEIVIMQIVKADEYDE